MKIVTKSSHPDDRNTELSGSIELTIAGGLILKLGDAEGDIEVTLTAEDVAALKSAFK